MNLSSHNFSFFHIDHKSLNCMFLPHIYHFHPPPMTLILHKFTSKARWLSLILIKLKFSTCSISLVFRHMQSECIHFLNPSWSPHNRGDHYFKIHLNVHSSYLMNKDSLNFKYISLFVDKLFILDVYFFLIRFWMGLTFTSCKIFFIKLVMAVWLLQLLRAFFIVPF